MALGDIEQTNSVVQAALREREDADFLQIGELLEKRRFRLGIKRVFDILISLVGLLCVGIFFIAIGALIKIDSKGPVFYKQTRVGKNGKPFRILKFRTMVVDADRTGQLITVGEDSRITKVGRFLRRTKIDELPQIINIIKGDMSFVGPRPEVLKYVSMYSDAQAQVLLVRPGITDIASIEYRNESDILALSEDPERTYIEEIMPRKLSYNMQYLKNISVINDVRIICTTVLKVLK